MNAKQNWTLSLAFLPSYNQEVTRMIMRQLGMNVWITEMGMVDQGTADGGHVCTVDGYTDQDERFEVKITFLESTGDPCGTFSFKDALHSVSGSHAFSRNGNRIVVRLNK